METEIRNWVIRFESWEAYNAKTKEEAIELFRKEHSEAEIIEIEN